MSQPKDHDPLFKLRTRPLVSQEYVPEVGDYVVVHNQELAQRSAFLSNEPNADESVLEVLGQRIVNERNSNNVRLETTYYPRRTTGDVIPDGPWGIVGSGFPATVEERIIYEQLREFIDAEVITKRLEPIGGQLFSNNPIFRQVAYRQELTRYGPNHNLRTTYEGKESFQQRQSQTTDPLTGNQVRKIRSVVTAIPMGLTVPLPAGTEITYEPVATGIWIKTISQLLQVNGETPISGPGAFATFTYDTRIDYAFPAFIRPFDPFIDIIRSLNSRERRTVFNMRIRVRRGYTANVWAEKKVSYHAERPTKPVVFDWRYIDWRHDGMLFQVDIPNVIANETPIDAITFFNDTFFQGWNEHVVFPASLPINTDQYLEQIGTKTLVDVDITQIENRVYRKTETRVVME